MAKILVIDDELGILDLLDDALYRKGHDIVLATNGQSGLKLFQEQRPNVTLLDFKMPDIGGLAVLRQIRTLDPNALVIMMTGFGTEEREQQARALGAAEFLDKSLMLYTLGATLDRVLTQIGKTMMVEQRRRFPRFLIQIPISFIQNGVMFGEGTSYDLSAEGCMVASQTNVGVGDHVELKLHLFDHQEVITPLMVEIAAVRWAIQQQCGLEFLSLQNGDKTRLLQYVQTLQTASP